MPKVLRPKEQVSFLQTRAPGPLWQYLKKAAIDHAADGTITRLCSDHIVEFLQTRPWLKGMQWLRPQAEDGVYRGMSTGFRQINLPLSNLDADGKVVTSREYLKTNGLLELADADKHALRAALDGDDLQNPKKMESLIRVIAAQLGVSGATFGYTYLDWLERTKFPLAGDKPAMKKKAAPPAEPAPASRYAVRPKK